MQETAELEAYSHIRERILRGRFAADSLISQDQIARDLNMSRIPVRDALRRLAADGLVTIRSNRRAVVTKLSWPEVREIFEIRAALEELAAREAAKNLTASALNELQIISEYLERYSFDSDKWVVRHEEFHDFVAASSGRPRLRTELRRLRELVVPYFRIYSSSHGNAELPRSGHVDLVSAMTSEDAANVGKRFSEHVLTAINEIEPIMKSLS